MLDERRGPGSGVSIPSGTDQVLRAITDDGAFRVIAVSSTETVQGAIAAQKASGAMARTFADLLTGAILVRETMSPDLRVQAILQGEDPKTRMVADSHPDGMTRGLVNIVPPRTTLELGPKAVLQIARTVHNGAIHQGVVSAPARGGISSALMTYMQESEQVVSMIAVANHVNAAGTVAAAGGYIVQLLPEVEQGPLGVMSERLKDFEDIEPLLAKGAASPSELLDEILYRMPFTRLDTRTVRFGCNCGEARLLASLSTLPRSEIQEFIDEGKPLEMTCDFCTREYFIQTEMLRGLLQDN